VDGSPHEPGGDRWTVVDWKTDSVTAASESLLEAHYRPQVALYAECWSSVLERARERATSPPA
jgi:ATP-dependent exoDNAse (exonuclease V) beta subunit